MAKYKELVYMVQDLLKNSSNDGYYTEDHIIFLLDKARAVLLDNRYTKVHQEIPESNYQTICITLEKTNKISNVECSGSILKSKEEIPDTLNVSSPLVYPSSYFLNTEVSYVSPERFRFVGHNKWLQNIIYVTEFNNHLYLTSANPQYEYLEKLEVKGIFENTEEAASLSCNSPSSENKCDILEQEYPIEEILQIPLIEMVVKEISTGLYKPKDDENNAKDDISDLYTFIARNTKSKIQKQIDG